MSRRDHATWAAVLAVGLLAAGGLLPRFAGGQESAKAGHASPAGSPAEIGHPQGHDHGAHDHGDGAGMEGHLHAPVPDEYRAAHVPAAAWTSPRMIARGREIYAARCAVCHGDDGGGQGPAAVGLPLRPPDLRDVRMVREMAGNYWFWRVSEGGAVEPFRDRGSVMPAWKDVLSVEDRWAVIAYQHTFSGHAGPHVTSEHPELLGPVRSAHGPMPPGRPVTGGPGGHGGHGAGGVGAGRSGDGQPGSHKH